MRVSRIERLRIDLAIAPSAPGTGEDVHLRHIQLVPEKPCCDGSDVGGAQAALFYQILTSRRAYSRTIPAPSYSMPIPAPSYSRTIPAPSYYGPSTPPCHGQLWPALPAAHRSHHLPVPIWDLDTMCMGLVSNPNCSLGNMRVFYGLQQGERKGES